MVNAEGEWVVAEPDQASWDQYQAKAKVSAAAQQAASLGSKELQERGLECPLDKRLFVDPTKTPCCNTTYCNECITNALLESGLTCPSCSTEDIVLDHLLPDNEITSKIRSYQEEIAPNNIVNKSPKSPGPKAEKQKSRGSTGNPDPFGNDDDHAEHERKSRSPKSEPSSPDKTVVKMNTPKPEPASIDSKKRPPETDLKNSRTPPGPSAAAIAKELTMDGTNPQSSQMPVVPPVGPQRNQLSFNAGTNTMGQGLNAMVFPNINSMNGFPGMYMNSSMYNPSMMGNNTFLGQDGSWNMCSQAYPQQQMSMTGPGFQNGMCATAGYNQKNMHMPKSNSYNGRNGIGPKGHGTGSFPNQQRSHFHGSNDEDSAYFRKPVNPHRHQGRRSINRPTDYREI